jgi:hypothetical protein
MATAVIAGIATAGSAVIAAGGFAAFAAAGGSLFAAFALGAGLSLLSRALAPKLDLGTQMGGRSVMTREAAHSRKIVYGRARIGGNVVFLESSGTDNKYLYLVTAIAGHEIDAFEQVWFNDEKVWENNTFTTAWRTSTNASTSPYINFDFYKGDQTAADSGLVAASNKWTTDHKLLDTAYIVVKLTYDQEKFAQGLPNISTVIRGKKVLDPSNNTTAWSQNPALCIYDYLRDTKYGLGETVANILTSSVTTAKGVCDETISLSGGGTQVRYTIDGVVDTANSIKSNIETMIGSMAGRLVYSGGKFEIHAGEYVAPSVTIDESMIIGEISVQTKQSRRNAYNGVKGVFVSEEDNYVVADYPAQISSTYAAQDGDPIYLDMPLPYTINNVRAQRLAKLALLRSRQQEAITIPCNLTALKFKIGDNISVTNTRLGYSGKVFEVVGYSMAFSANQMVVNVEAIETASSIWDWSTSDQEVFLGGGEVSIYDGTTAAAPTNLTVTGDSFVTADGAFNTAFNVAWTNADDAFTDHYIVEHKLTTASEYIAQQTNSSPFTIVGLRNSQQYNVRVKAVNEIGVSSAYVSATPTAATDTTAPSLPTSITATAGYKSISLAWTNPSEKDFNNVEIYRSTSSSGTYAEVSNVAGGFGAKAEHLDGGLADATAFYYKFKSVDLSGNKSAFSSVVNATTNAAAIDGSPGLSTYQATAFRRKSGTAPSAPSGGTFNFGTQAFTAPTDWHSSIPSGTDPIYACNFNFSVSGNTGTVTAGTWSSPVLLAENGTDGAAGVRNAAGYVYYTISSGSAPNAPSATAYNFGNGVFTGLTANWSRTPPTVTGADAQYWAASYYATEATYQGTQTISFGTVFSTSTFNGLVSFTSLNTALANTGGNVTTIDGGLITTDTISVNKLTGDVTEVYPIAQRFYTNTGGLQLLTNAATIFSNFSIPAPALNIAKRQKIDLNLFFLIENTGQSPVDYSQITLTIQKKSKGSTPVQITSTGNKVTVESESIPYNQIISLPFNALETLDVSGGVSNSSSPSIVGDIRSIYYDLSANKTYLMISTSSDIFSTNDDLYFSSDSFTSTGTWFSPDTFDDYWVNTPIDANASYVTQATISSYHQKGRSTFVIPWKVSYGKSTTGSEYRLRASISNPQSGVTYALLKMTGTLENIS